MHDNEHDTYDLIALLQKQIDQLSGQVERQSLELTILRNEFELVKHEGCWLSKQTPDHLHGGHKDE